MYHPMLTFAVMQTRQEDLLRELRRDQVRAEAQRRQAASAGRSGMRRRVAAYVARRPRPTATRVPSAS
jgi:hypothetical protein